jgi:hypothetical protein
MPLKFVCCSFSWWGNYIITTAKEASYASMRYDVLMAVFMFWGETPHGGIEIKKTVISHSFVVRAQEQLLIRLRG